MSCDCPGAPHLSDPLSQNLTKMPSETLTIRVPWCEEVGADGSITWSQWDWSPTDGDTPLSVIPGTTEDDPPFTVGSVSGGVGGTLYAVTNTERRIVLGRAGDNT